MNAEQTHKLTEHLARFVTESRRDAIERVLARRTRYVTVVLEDIYQPHNAAAVIRTCDCYGVQDLHVIETRNRFEPNEAVSMGAGKWVDVHRHGRPSADPTAACLASLKAQGYQIVAMTLREPSIALHEVTGRLRESAHPWQLREEEIADLRLAWYQTVVPRADAHARRILGA